MGNSSLYVTTVKIGILIDLPGIDVVDRGPVVGDGRPVVVGGGTVVVGGGSVEQKTIK